MDKKTGYLSNISSNLRIKGTADKVQREVSNIKYLKKTKQHKRSHSRRLATRHYSYRQANRQGTERN